MDRIWWLGLVLVTWGAAGFLLKIVGVRLDNSSAVLGIIIGYTIVGTVFGFAGGGSLGITWVHGLAALIGVCYIVGNWAFLHMARTEEISVLAPLAGLSVVVPIVLGLLVLGEPFTMRKLIGILFAMIAMILLS